MFRNLFMLLLFSTLGLCALQAKDSDNLVELIFRKAGSANFSSDKSLQREVTNYFDFDEMAKRILGDELKKRKPSEVIWFKNHIQEIITRTVYPKASDFLRNVKLNHKVLSSTDNKQVTMTIVKK